MSILTRTQVENDDNIYGLNLGVSKCFLCGDSIDLLPCVFWSGNDGQQIFLHYSCVALFSAHLQSDFTRLLARNDI
jgi:hypothetical protein